MNFNSFSNIKSIEKVYEPTMFWNFSLDKGRLKNFVCWFLKTYGEKKTLEFLEQLKILGFGYATRAGISLGIEDLKIPPTKAKLLAEAELALAESALSYKRGEITGIEKMQRFIETWNE
jgi:DNA-directed RNA polymerase subunit beta'